MENESKQENDQASHRSQEIRRIGLLTVIMGDLIGCMGLGIAVGYLAYSKGGAPWWVLLLSSLIGLFLAFFRVYKVSQKE